MVSATPRLRQIGSLLAIIGAINLAQAVVLVFFTASPTGDPILAALSELTFLLVILLIVAAVFFLTLAAAVFLGSRAAFQFLAGNVKVPGFLIFTFLLFFGVIWTFLFLVEGAAILLGAGVVVAAALLMVVLGLVISPETRTEVDAADYERPDFDFADRVLAQRGLHEPVPEDEQDDDRVEFVYVETHSKLCPECDLLNEEDWRFCQHCGAALT